MSEAEPERPGRLGWFVVGGCWLLLALAAAGLLVVRSRIAAAARQIEEAGARRDEDRAASDRFQAEELARAGLEAGPVWLQAELAAGRPAAPGWQAGSVLGSSRYDGEDRLRVELVAVDGDVFRLRATGELTERDHSGQAPDGQTVVASATLEGRARITAEGVTLLAD